jgi:hypothetical protein
VPKTPRPAISVETAAAVYFRDGRIRALCHRPTVFHLAFKYADSLRPLVCRMWSWPTFIRTGVETLRLCLTNSVLVSTTFTRTREAVRTIPQTSRRRVGSVNTRKSAREKTEYVEANPPHRVSGKYGEPTRWDGLSCVFVVLARESCERLTVTEMHCLHTLEAHLSGAVPKPKA